MRKQYIEQLKNLLDKVQTDDNIDKAATMLVEAIESKKLIYAFGASHAGILTQELLYRAGGLALVNPIFDSNLMLDVRPVTKTSAMENLVGFGTIIAQNVGFKAGDVLIAHSVSGRNAVMLELVTFAQSVGVKVIAVTNVAYSTSVTSRHVSGKRLFELADIVLDNHGEIGDACMVVPASHAKMAATSTVIGSAIVNSLVVATVERLQANDPKRLLPIFASANMDNTQNHNEAIFKQYSEQIRYQ
jgi:uncharacterized phosphosugar-binding protein